MTPGLSFALIYAPVTQEHLKAIERKYYALIRSEIEIQLQAEPDVETRNRKPLKRPVVVGGNWELRCGPDNRFRVFYEVDRRNGQVDIMAIGVKRGSRLFVGGRRITL